MCAKSCCFNGSFLVIKKDVPIALLQPYSMQNFKSERFVFGEKLMHPSYRYFENKACKYYPCHADIDHINCLFCYCPLYTQENCPGTYRYLNTERAICVHEEGSENPTMLDSRIPNVRFTVDCEANCEPKEITKQIPQVHSTINDRKIKDCTYCTFPHKAENYDIIMQLLSQ